jgi:hypothetical protein
MVEARSTAYFDDSLPPGRLYDLNLSCCHIGLRLANDSHIEVWLPFIDESFSLSLLTIGPLSVPIANSRQRNYRTSTQPSIPVSLRNTLGRQQLFEPWSSQFLFQKSIHGNNLTEFDS